MRNNGQDVFWTEDYELFITLSGNRSLNINHINRLKKCIRNEGWRKSSLIIVNHNMRVYDGQHRIQALKELKREIGRTYKIGYIIDDQLSLRKTQNLNSLVLPWKPTDYIESNIRLGREDYKFIKEVMNEFSLPYTAVLALIESNNGNISTDAFRSGDIEIKDKQLIWFYASCIQKIKPYFKNYNSRSFVSAMAFFLSKTNFNFDEFLHKVALNRDKLYPVTTINKYKQVIQEAYNFRRRDGKINLIQI